MPRPNFDQTPNPCLLWVKHETTLHFRLSNAVWTYSVVRFDVLLHTNIKRSLNLFERNRKVRHIALSATTTPTVFVPPSVFSIFIHFNFVIWLWANFDNKTFRQLHSYSMLCLPLCRAFDGIYATIQSVGTPFRHELLGWWIRATWELKEWEEHRERLKS